ncbi:MAG: ATPase [Marine Group III euryarchaeote CG-Epi6]|uniref:ATPase n=1 Tax=Marine Group III euryarchaeote CG-Epi6 TaxID=1889000 RepID=A0A1J5SXP3_9ARCH|nr:MAG: ATPase [Marine Group III euryarchaeote CG-Epi6]|tara:strand:+ start:536 stop:2299 length:1764 start_codon:yes stop_codon:yes gene_type:complete
MRIAVLFEDKCKPNSPAFEYLQKYAGSCGGECIQVDENDKCKILEDACPPCLMRAKNCPGDAVKVINLPEELETDMIHRYSLNGFRLFRLPTPSKESIIGILGPNGMGKSTAFNILNGTIIPNLGEFEAEETLWENVIETLPRGELRDFLTELNESSVKVALKPQYVDHIPKAFKGNVGKLLSSVNERGLYDEMVDKFGLGHILERNLDQLSGGELQRVAICATLLKDADVYFFDEPSSYLDIYERMRIVRIIQELSESARVIVIEHDLAVLDVIADLTHIVYGKKGAFGIFTPARTTRKAINAYIEGYLVEQNVRIRDKPIKFLEHPPRTGWDGMGLVQWPKLSKKLGSFSLEAKAGELLSGQVLGVVGANATGKTTFVKMLAGDLEPDEGEIESDIAVSYKPQYINIQEGRIVEDLLQSVEGYDEHIFSTELSRPLNLKPLLEREMQTLSGGELQRVAIAECLLKEADLYLLDEPSAYLDANQRMVTAKAIRRFMESRGKSALIVDHDIYFIDYISDGILCFGGDPGNKGIVEGPYKMREGMNIFLERVDVTFRRDKNTHRPRVNKPGSRLDREQKSKKEYYYSS